MVVPEMSKGGWSTTRVSDRPFHSCQPGVSRVLITDSQHTHIRFSVHHIPAPAVSQESSICANPVLASPHWHCTAAVNRTNCVRGRTHHLPPLVQGLKKGTVSSHPCSLSRNEGSSSTFFSNFTHQSWNAFSGTTSLPKLARKLKALPIIL